MSKPRTPRTVADAAAHHDAFVAFVGTGGGGGLWVKQPGGGHEVVGVDLFYVHDSGENRHQMLSIVDFSSGYHVVVPLTKKDTSYLEETFAETWIGTFGAPSTVCVDLETGLQKAFA